MDDIIHDGVVQLNIENSDKLATHKPPVAGQTASAAKFILRSGWMLKLGQKIKNWKRRFFILLDDGSITYYKV
jgi:hypothetical protein